MTWKTYFANSTPGDPCVVTISSINANDILLGSAVTDAANASDLNTTPSGFAELHRGQTTVDNMTHQVVWKQAAGGETSVSFDSTSGNSAIAFVAVFDGIDTTNPIDVTSLTDVQNSSAADHDIGTFTPFTDGCDIIYIEGRDDGNSDYSFTFSTQAGTTGAWSTGVDQNSGFYNQALGYCVQTTAGSITARCTSTSGGRSGILIALRPTAGALVVDKITTYLGDQISRSFRPRPFAPGIPR